MYTEVYGSGPPLLMIHGNHGDMSAFARNVPYFATHYQVILADSRSQGRSVDPGHPLTFEMMADDYAALLDAMHISSAYIIGWSDGGINALLLAIRHPGGIGRQLTQISFALPQRLAQQKICIVSPHSHPIPPCPLARLTGFPRTPLRSYRYAPHSYCLPAQRNQ